MERLSDRWRRVAKELRKTYTKSEPSKQAVLAGLVQSLEECAREYDITESPAWLEELTSALGWQGGTIHQALDAVRRLVKERKEKGLSE